MQPQENSSPESRSPQNPSPEIPSPENSPSPTAAVRNPWGSLVLFLSGLLFWGPVGLAVWTISTARFGASGMGPMAGVYLIGALFNFVLYAAFAGGCLLAIYACIQKPWQNKPVSILFVLQLITLAGFIVLGVLSSQ